MPKFERRPLTAVDPHAACLNGARHLVRLVHVARPDAGAESVDGVVGDGDGLLLRLEGGDGRDRAEDLLLEDAHVVGAGEDRRLDVVAALDDVVAGAPRQDHGALGRADVDVLFNLRVLREGNLRAHHRGRIERVTGLDGLRPGDDALHEGVVDVLLHQQPRLTRADLALVEREEHGALDSLVQERRGGSGQGPAGRGEGGRGEAGRGEGRRGEGGLSLSRNAASSCHFSSSRWAGAGCPV